MKGVLLDLQGNPITGPDQKERAYKELREFMEKHRDRFADWFKSFGPNVRPPIFYDLNKQCWEWSGE